MDRAAELLAAASRRGDLRPFRGVHKEYLEQYVAVFESGHNTKTATPKFLRTVLRPITRSDR